MIAITTVPHAFDKVYFTVVECGYGIQDVKLRRLRLRGLLSRGRRGTAARSPFRCASTMWLHKLHDYTSALPAIGRRVFAVHALALVRASDAGLEALAIFLLASRFLAVTSFRVYLVRTFLSVDLGVEGFRISIQYRRDRLRARFLVL